MPATEQTWRDSKLLHLIFGISGLAMLITTIWMLAADHRREWKDYQRKFQSIEAWTAQARIDQQTGEQYQQSLKEAEAALAQAQRELPPANLVTEFEEAVIDNAESRGEKVDLSSLESQYKAIAKAADDDKPAARDKFRDMLAVYIKDAKFREDGAASYKKFQSAYLDEARSNYELAVGNDAGKAKIAEQQAAVDEWMAKVDEALTKSQEAKSYRMELERLVGDMYANEAAAKKQLDEVVGKKTQLEKALYERESHAMTDVAELPILDAFGRPIEIKQIWLPKLTINYNFSDVARFDRCTSCHLAMDKTAPGSATVPGYPRQHPVEVEMATPAEVPAAIKEKHEGAEATEELYTKLLREVYGIQLAERGLIDESDPVVSVVTPESAAAKAGIEVGDVIIGISDAKIFGKPMVYNYLLETVTWGKPLKVTVRRGLPHPYASHPRLDLFVGSLSPHKMADIGCTICHDGQGSATAFKWASHTPNDPLEAQKWQREYGWFDNHHWIYPMTPKRFSESLCLKCHHEVTELEPSVRFPEPPAPKLVEGFHLIQQFGCFGCHEINGYDGPVRRVGPDLRSEPNYAPAAEALLFGGGLNDQQKNWAEDVVRDPSNDSARRALSESLRNAESLPGNPTVTKKLVNLLDDVEAPGKLRKVGPSLRHVASKVDYDFLYSWIQKPSNFRPSTKMPQFFGLTNQLDEQSLELSHRFEPIEIRGVVEYLLAKSQPFEYIAPPKSVKEKASAERGKMAFEIRCLACHQHADFPAGTMTQGPDLSRIGAKLGTPNNQQGPKWLYTWLKNPAKYHARTVMPNMILDPIPGPDGELIDPAADIAAFLMNSRQDWQPQDIPGRDLSDEEEKSLNDLAMEFLRGVTTRRMAAEYLEKGIPENRAADFKGDEVELVGEITVGKKLQYIGRRTISKYGCSGCHDVPGFEDAKPIGTGLADWARKTPDKLAFEQINEYMKFGHGKPGPENYNMGEHGDVTDAQIEEAETSGEHHSFNFLNMDADTGYFMEKLMHHQREGFIWQKLREPRSYDYEKAQNKGYNERLRMPQFTGLDDQQRESVITFVLGLVAEPPASQYVYKPTPRRAAEIEGLQVIQKFNCTGCHTLEMERWVLDYEPGDFPDPPEKPGQEYSFLKPHFTPQQVKASLETDARGRRHATVTGMAAVDAEGKSMRVDEDGAPIEPGDTETKAFFTVVPWDNVLINGTVREAGLDKIQIPEKDIANNIPPHGGFLARLAYPVVVEEGKKANSNLNADEVWGWLPPPLVGEGRKVQTAWLYDFLLDPKPIRPTAVLRMPKFNMSPDDAKKLVSYFAAVDNTHYPYNFDPRTRDSYLEAQSEEHPDRFNDALKIVTDNGYCVQCHIVGDFVPKAAKGPQLDEVYRRLRPDYLRDWIAGPKRILPYTGMPDNVKPDKPVNQALYKGTAEQQLNALVDLLLNFPRFMESKTKIAPMVKPPAEEPQKAEAPVRPQPQDAAQ